MGRGRRIIWVLLLIAALLRGWIAWSGGQFFTPDESRYAVSREAAGLILQGKIREGLTLPLATGEHPLFKLAGILPALVEAKAGADPAIPAFFFSLFSELNLVLIWLCARRLGLTVAEQVWTVLLATCSVALFFYGRHLYPYDLSLSLCLLAFFTGLKPAAGPGRLTGVGLLAGAAFLAYLAYWLMAGVVMALCVLYQAGGWRRLPARALLVGGGFVATLGALWLLDQWGGGRLVTNTGNFSGLIYDPNFGNSYWIGWEYLFRAEECRAVIFLCGVGWAAWSLIKDPAQRSWQSPIGIGLAGVAALYLAMIVGAEILNRAVVTGRVMRVELPFFCILGGIAMARLSTWSGGTRRWLPAVLAVAIIGSAIPSFLTVLRQEFPGDFKNRGLALMKQIPSAAPGSYHRFVNVDHYLYEPETLSGEPAETLLAADHPYQFRPYLYEGFSPRKRQQRSELDQRMRLVRMEIPRALQVTGEPYGMIRLKIRFAAGREGMAEPILSLGPRGDGDLFFVRYASKGRLLICLESMGVAVFTGEPMAYEPGRWHELELFCGAMLPEAPGPADAGRAAQWQHYRSQISVRCDGREVLNGMALPHLARPHEVYAGYNLVGTGGAISMFSGEITDIRRGGLPAIAAGGEGESGYGAAALRIRFPLNAAGVPEPLVTVGLPSHATLGYVRVLPGGKVKLGAEFWGVGVIESDEITAAGDVPADVTFHFPALYPPAGDPGWGGVDRATQEARRSRLTILLNGRIVLDREVNAPVQPSAPVSFGENPVGGSWVTNKFSGRLVHARRLPPAER